MGRFSFKREERLHKKRDFEYILKEGKRFRARGFTLVLSKRQDEGLRRFGVIVSKKVRGSVKRNRSKRLVREFFRLNKEFFPPSCDIIVIVYTPLSRYHEVEEGMRALAPSIDKIR